MKLLLVITTLLLPCALAEKEENAYNASYIILAPKVVRPGLNFTLSVSIRKATGRVTIDAAIRERGSSDLVAQGQATAEAGELTLFDLEIPGDLSTPRSQYQLEVLGSGGGIEFNDTQELQFDVTHFAIFIQTDKAIYKPGQTVNYRILGVYPGMLPYTGEFDVEITDPDDNIIFIASGLKNESYGVITQALPMSSEPVLGEWKIKARAEGQEQIQTVTIDEYVLPKFDVEVTLPPFITKGDKNLNIQIGAKYTYGKPLEGSAEVVIKLQYYANTIKKDVRELHGTGDVMVSLDELRDLYKSINRHSEDLYEGMQVIVTATVTEGLTGLTQDNTAFVNYYCNPIKVEALPVSSSVFKPGLKYTTFLAVTHQDGSMLNDKERKEGILLVFKESTEAGAGEWARVGYPIPETGVVEATYDVSQGVTGLQIKAFYYRPSTQELDRERAQYDSWLTRMDSPSQTYLQIYLESQQVTIDDDVSMMIKTTEDPMKLTYNVIAQSNIVLSGSSATTGTTNVLTFRVTPDMAPKARVIVSFVTAGGEVIVDSVELLVDGAFRNKVNVSFDRDTSEPGDPISFSVEASPASLVGILAVDQSVLILKEGNDITQDQVITELSKIDTSISQDRWGIAYRKKRSVYYPRYSSGNTAARILHDAGLLVISDALVNGEVYDYYFFDYDRPVAAAIPEAGIAQEDGVVMQKAEAGGGTSSDASQITVRKQFPETWLWSDAVTDANGRVIFNTTVPDTITSWLGSAFAVSLSDGFGVAPGPSKTTVFKPFFVSLNLPYSIVRKETLVLQATVFNYFDEDVKATVSLGKSTKFEAVTVDENGIEKSSGTGMTDKVLVPAGSGVSVFFPIKITKSGFVNLEVRAVTDKAGDAVRRQLLVEPEGVAHSVSESRLFNEATNTDINEVFEIGLPPPEELVEGSVRVLLSITGDIMGPTMNNLDSLLKMPYGCGEQNMMNFAPDVFVYEYLTVTGQSSPAIKDKAYRFMVSGYQRELNYKHTDDGSFSAFGERDDSGSVWLTSFVVKSFSGASKFITIDPKVIEQAVGFIIDQQNSREGTFNEPGRIVDRGIEGGVSPGATLTAYITIALQEVLRTQNLTKETRDRAVASVSLAQSYLERQLGTIRQDPYALALVTYALAVTNSESLADFRAALDTLAITQGGQRHWSDIKEEIEPADDFWYNPYHGPASSEVEMTSYALLTYLEMGDLPGAASIAKWMTHQRNAFGGYGSTQDTVVGLQALTSFALVFREVDPQVDLTVTLSSDPSYSKSLIINTDNAIVLQQTELPTQSGSVTVSGSGRGTCLMTLAVFYNLKAVHERKFFEYTISIDDTDNDNIQIEACGRYLGEAAATSMCLMDIGIPSGFTADTDHLAKLLEEHQLVQKYETEQQSVYLYFQEIPKDEMTCVTVHATRSNVVANVQPKYARLYDYYTPSEQALVEYSSEVLGGSTICDVCPECAGCSGGGARQPLLSVTLLLATLFVAVFVSRA